MLHKDIKWANKELPGLTEEELNELSVAKLASIENGRNIGLSLVESGEWKIRQSNGGKIAGNNAKESGQFHEFAASGGNANSENQLEARKELGNRIRKCTVCGFEGKGWIMDRKHFANCYSDPIIDLNTGLYYTSIRELASILQINPSTLKVWLRHQTKQWRYCKDLERS